MRYFKCFTMKCSNINGAIGQPDRGTYNSFWAAHTIALLTLERGQVRPLDTHDMPHARELEHA